MIINILESNCVFIIFKFWNQGVFIIFCMSEWVLYFIFDIFIYINIDYIYHKYKNKCDEFIEVQ